MTVSSRSAADPIRGLRNELGALGIDPGRAFQTLPDWWEEAIAHPSGVIEVKGFLAKHFGLEFGLDGSLQTRPLPRACFKTRAGTAITEIASAHAVATAVARLLAAATRKPWGNGLPAAKDLRTAILARGRPWVGLDDLLDACWHCGVAVGYLPDLPVTARRMDGIVTFVRSRPVIVITKRPDSAAWVLFVLAHEMGHLARGHLTLREGESIVDEEVAESEKVDQQESEANAYALALLTGNATSRLQLPRLMKAQRLAEAAKGYGRENKIDPGHVLLNAAKSAQQTHGNIFGLANAALKFLEPQASASTAFRKHVRDNIDAEALPDDSVEFLERMRLL